MLKIEKHKTHDSIFWDTDYYCSNCIDVFSGIESITTSRIIDYKPFGIIIKFKKKYKYG